MVIKMWNIISAILFGMVIILVIINYPYMWRKKTIIYPESKGQRPVGALIKQPNVLYDGSLCGKKPDMSDWNNPRLNTVGVGNIIVKKDE